ncbi:MAG: formylglycine-generating enzyme family protein [Marinifilaceae bacterium]
MNNFNLHHIWCIGRLLSLLIWTSCSKIEDFASTTDKEPYLTKQSISAVISDGLYKSWSVGDIIILLHNGQSISAKAEDSGITTTLSDVIEGTFTNDAPLFGIFPIGKFVTSDNGSLVVSVPSTQTDVESGYDKEAAITVARTISDSLYFHSICGGIKLNFQMSGVTKVELESVDGYALCGTVRVKWDEQGKPCTDNISNANNIITISTSKNTSFTQGKDYYISTLPCDIYGGYRLSIYKNELVAHYFGVHQTIERASFITPNDFIEDELIFDDPDAPLVEEDRPLLDATTTALLRQYQMNPTSENKKSLLDQMGIRYDKVVARKKAKLRELEREAKTQNLIDEMQNIVDEMVNNRDIRLEQQFLRLIDPRIDDNPNDAWMVLRGALAPNAYIGYAPVTNAEYAIFKGDYIYNQEEDNYPAVNITISDAIAYCDWLTSQDNSHLYRLPSDEEWILGAGHMPKDVTMNSGRTESGLTAVDAYSQTTGACGGIDFWGNCWEWTSSTNANDSYIIKGGSWDSDRDDCRSEKSDVTRTGSKGFSNVGFRIVRTDS